MTGQQNLNYDRIAEAIAYINTHFKSQPNLDDVARHIHVSPFHFQRLFTHWAGISPKKFLQYTTLSYAKTLLQENQVTLFDAAFETGLSGSSRLHHLFVSLEGMTPAEYKNGGKSLYINFSFAESPFGRLLVASTPKGICFMAFADDADATLHQLKSQFPNARYSQVLDLVQQQALEIFKNDWSKMQEVKLHVKGTAFQLKVWETLLKIPLGKLTNYQSLARAIEKPGASRAVGSAIGSNPVAYLIPCHRVIQATGVLGNYMWGTVRKTAIIGWEGAKTNPEFIS